MLVSLTARLVRALRPFGLAKKFVNWILEGERFFSVDQIFDPLEGKIGSRLILELPGRGCAWYKASGGCTMCGFNRKLEEVNRQWRFSGRDIAALYELAELLSRSEKPELLYIYNGGSFLNEEEIPFETQLAIARAVGLHSDFKVLFVESRPEFITTERLLPLLDILERKRLEIGIGLEAVTDKVRESYICKGFNLSAYEKAVKTLKSCRVLVLTYVFLKPLHLSEREAIEEAIKTTEYAFRVGTDEVSLSCAFIQEGTKMAEAYRCGKFRPPWLWSIIEVVSRSACFGPVRIGSFKDEPPPIAVPFNCPKCSQRIEGVLQDYNISRNLTVLEGLDCECKRRWVNEIKKA